MKLNRDAEDVAGCQQEQTEVRVGIVLVETAFRALAPVGLLSDRFEPIRFAMLSASFIDGEF